MGFLIDYLLIGLALVALTMLWHRLTLRKLARNLGACRLVAWYYLLCCVLSWPLVAAFYAWEFVAGRRA